MFDFGFWELVLVFIVALLVIGPERLPGVARQLGLWVGRAKRFVTSVRSDIERELRAEELREMLNRQQSEIEQLRGMLEETQAEVREELEEETDGLVQAIEEQIQRGTGPASGPAGANTAARDGSTPRGVTEAAPEPGAADPKPGAAGSGSLPAAQSVTVSDDGKSADRA